MLDFLLRLAEQLGTKTIQNNEEINDKIHSYDQSVYKIDSEYPSTYIRCILCSLCQFLL